MLRGPIRALRIVSDWRLWALGAAVALGLAFHEAGLAWSPPDGGHARAVVKLAIYWGLWLAWPAALWLVLRAAAQLRRARPFGALVALALLAPCAGLLWARFVEPQQLRVIETPLGSACGVRIALVSDLHAGLYVRPDDVERVVRRLNTLDVDAVLFAGDWTFEPPHDLLAEFAPLALLRHPTYFVLGNHDEAMPGAALKPELLQALNTLGMKNLEGRRVALGRCEVAGLGDLEAGGVARDLAQLQRTPWHQPPAQRILLAHEPDTLYEIEHGTAGLLLAGHTHGGQINLPGLTTRLLQRTSRSGYQRGLYTPPGPLRVFVTSGIGMARLPLRFRMPPTIDVLGL